MKSKRLLLMLLIALIAPWAANAQTTVQIGDGTSATNSVPINTLWNYSITEQLYTAEEIGMPGTIQSISFNYALSEAKDFPIEVYMMNVEAANLSTGISLADADLVFNGTLSVTEPGWATITLDSPFVYDGTSNLLIGVNKGYVQWFSGSSWYYTSVANMTRYSSNDNNPYDTSTTPGTSTSYRPNIQMEIVAGSGPFCAKPTGVTVNYTGGTTAEVSWNSDAASFNIDVNGTVTNNVSNPYTLTGLNLATTYTVKVQAVCGGDNGSSDWTSGTNFSTDICMPEEQCNLTFVLTDTYGDSWNGNAIQVMDVTTGIVVATLANQNLDGTNGEETQTVTLGVCDGRELEFSWVSGSYVSEVEYTVTDINNEVVVEGSGAGFNTFTFTPSCTPVTCARPENVVVTYTGGDTAEVSWEAHAESYNIDVNGTVIEGITDNPYTLTNLDLATVYTVMVQAYCGAEDGLSNWTNPVSFRTDFCLPENTCELTFVVTDSYGDGWNGGAILVLDYDTYMATEDIELSLIGEIANEDLDEATGEETQTVTLAVCDGRELIFGWQSGNYDSEVSYQIIDNVGDVIEEGSGAGFDAFAYTVFCNSTCRKPINFAASEIAGRSVVLSWTELGEATSWTLAYQAETDTVVSYVENITTNPYTFEGLTPETKYYAMITPNCEDQYKWSDVISWTTDAACPKPHITVVPTPTSAEVSWTGFADEYEMEWAEVPASGAKDGLWLQYDNGTYATSIGNSSASTWTWGVMYPASMLAGNGLLSKVSIYENSYNSEDITINIYSGGDDAPETLVYTETVTPTGDGFHEITLAEVVTVDPTQNLWITLTEYGTYVLNSCSSTEPNNQWVESGGWYNIGDLASSLAEYGWMIRGYVEPSFDPDELDWQRVPGATSPVTLSPLTPETQYIVRIKALCGGEDGESEWATVSFFTPSLCTVPFDLESEVEATSATLSWTGYQESFNVRYRRTPYDSETYFYENFDEGLPTTWTTIDNDTTTVGNWIALSEINSVYTYYTSPLTGWAHSGADAVASASFVNGIGEVATDNYLVTPQVTFNGTLRFYATSEYSDPDTYEVLLSTTGNSISDFNVTLQAMGPATYGAWDEVLIDLSDYAGQQGYIAIHHVATDKYWLVIDDFGMFDMVFEDWTNTTVTENTLALTGLTPEAEYEWQVQGVNCDGNENTEWSEIASFTTPELTTITQTVALETGNNWFSANVEITLNDLKAALVEVSPNNAITIQGQTDNTKYNPNNHRWTGRLNALDLTQMYMISVGMDCEIALEGMPIDPTTQSITISNGANWIAYPFSSESMTLTNAFTGFAVTGDLVQSQISNSKYNRNRWQGQLTSLEPGKGYIYNSAATQDRTFTYPTGTSKVAQSSEKPMTTGLSKQVEANTKNLTPAQPSILKRNAKAILLDLIK